MLYCLVTGGVYLLIATLALEFTAKKMKLLSGVPEAILEDSGGVWLGLFFIMEFLFFVTIPTVAYSFFYPVPCLW